MNEEFRKFLYNQQPQQVIQQPHKRPEFPLVRLKQNVHRKIHINLEQEQIQKKIRKEEKQQDIPEKKEYNIMEKLYMNPIELVKISKEYSFGNYKKYYDIRLKEKWNDPRLIVLDGEYFRNKEILDIGCNDGTFTLLIALKYFPKLIRGIDIDYQLINKAIELMTEIEDKQKKIQKTEFTPIVEMPVSFQKYMNQPLSQLQQNEEINEQVNQMKEQQEQILNQNIVQFPNNVYFRVQNIIGNTKYDEQYDTVLCLSITKWIHLNFGDLGIERLFKKISEFTKVNGYLILEPQDWKSYKKKKYHCQEFKKNYKEIKLKPEKFTQILESKYNFKLTNHITPDDRSIIDKSKTTFKRPIFIYQKIEMVINNKDQIDQQLI